MATNVLLEPGVPDLAALGATSPEDLLGTGAPLAGEARAEPLPAAPGIVHLRLPLPGTLRGRPRGAGTGWVELRRYGAGRLAERLGARLTPPRSDSLAAREWNLLCALRAAGLATPAPLALVAEVHPLFAPRSALVTRALEGTRPAPEWFASTRDPLRRRRACTAIGLALGRLGAGGFDLPLAPEHLHLLEDGDGDRPELGARACALEQVLAARAGGAPPTQPTVPPGLRWRRLPEVVVTEVRGGRQRRGSTLGRLVRRLAPCDAARALTAAERRRVVLAAAGSRDPRALLALGR